MRRRKQKKKLKASQYDKLVVHIKNNLTTRLSDLLSKVFNSAQDKLFNMADEATSNKDQTRYFELINQIKSLKNRIADNYIKEIKKHLVPTVQYRENTRLDEKKSDELSLIDTNEMEGMVLVSSISGRATARYREQLSHLEARLEYLALKSETVFNKKALNPTNFCQAFNDSIKNYFDPVNKKILFNLFEAEMMNKLESLYDSINNRLIDADILPQIKLNLHDRQQKRRQDDKKEQLSNGEPDQSTDTQLAPLQEDAGNENRAGTQYGNPSNATGSEQTATNTQHGPTGDRSTDGNNNKVNMGSGGDSVIGGYAMTAAPGGTYHHPQQSPANTTSPQSQGHANPGSMGKMGINNTTTTNTTSSEFQHYTAGMPASQVGHVLGDFLGTPINQETIGGQAQTPASGSPIFPDSTAQHFGHQEIIQALSDLQTQPQFAQPQQARFDAEAIKQAVIAELAKSSGGVITKRINQIAEKTIDFIELIFDAIIDDEDISDTIKTLLLRLQIPIIKASITDQEFFIYDDHAARVLLDRIAEVGVGVTDHTDEIYKQLDKIISNILAEYDMTTGVFQQALDDLNQIIQKQEDIARNKEIEAQQQTLRHHARNTVLKALRVVTTGKTLPEAVHPLILKRWPTLMFNHYLQHGKENEEWVSLVETLRDIIESIQPVRTADDYTILLEDKDELLEITRNYLSHAIKSKPDIEKVIHGLVQTYKAHIDAVRFSDEEIEKAGANIAKMDDESEDDTTEILSSDEVQSRLPANIMPGMWFHLYMGEDQISRRCKLSVIVLEDSNLMFVNHKGELVVEKSFDELTIEMASDRTKIIMGHSVFDHALKSVITRLSH